MAEEIYENDDNTEYQLNEENTEDGASVYDPEQSAEDYSGEAEDTTYAAPKKKGGFKKFLLWLIVVIICVVVAYKLFSAVFGGKQPVSELKTPQATVTTESSVATQRAKTADTLFPAEEQATEQDAAVEKNAPPEEGSAEPAAQESQESALQAEAAQLQETNKILAEHLKTMQDANQKNVSNLAGRVSDLKYSVGSLQTAVKNMTAQMKKQQAKQQAEEWRRANAHKIQQKAVRRMKKYFVQAVIPGRAWLLGADGGALTATVGDEIPGYGKVTGIDSYSGTVSTTSGYKIYYGISNQ